MFKKTCITTVVCFFLTCLVAPAQVQVRNLSLQQALQQAKVDDKVVMLWIESASCKQCNEVALQGFVNPVYARAVNNSAITIKISEDSPDFPALDSQYHIRNSMGVLFLHADGSFLSRYAGTSSYHVINMEQLDKALNRKEHPDTELLPLQTDYDNGKREFSSLYQLVAKKEALELEHDKLTEEMIQLVPRDSANSLSFLQFLAAQAPVVGSKGDEYLRRDAKNFNDAWYMMPLQKRSSINTRIIIKSRNKAIREKDLTYAMRVASFASRTHTDGVMARKTFETNLIMYYKAVNDTANYLQKSVSYFDRHLMSLSVDSVLRVDSIRQMEAFANATQSPPTVMQPAGSPVMTRVSFAPMTQRFAVELNNGAYDLYTYTKDPFYLSKALGWSKRANEFYDSPEGMDTYAKLLYKTGQKEGAISMQEKAIKLLKERKRPSKEFEDILAKMKTGGTIDNY